MIPVLLFAAVRAQAPDALARYAKFAEAHPSLQVHFVANMNGQQEAKGTVRFRRPDLFFTEAKGENVDYSLTVSPKEYLEIENKRKVYDDYPGYNKIVFYQSDISSMGTLLVPRFLLAADLKMLFKKGYDSSRDGSNDVLHQTIKGDQGFVEEDWATIDPEGKMASFRRKLTGAAGSRDVSWSFSGYTESKDVSGSAFNTVPPVGYSPHSVPRLSTPLPIGAAVPTKGWEQNGKPVNLLEASGHKPFLLIFSESDSVPGQAAVKWSHMLAGKMPVMVVGEGSLKDPDGSRIKELAAPGSPMFYLVGADGKIVKLWFGFDPDKAKALESDVLESAKGTPAKAK